MSWSDQAKVYRGRKPHESPLWQLLDEHFDEFEERYDQLFGRQYGPKVDIRPLTELFRASVLKMLKDEGRLDDTLIRKILYLAPQLRF